ncbi:MAG TPA: hypothetical protein VM103_01170, partial [Candidatus Paceibacterota bacterium]|nr:hypothetical protein [Candidatus Paceibacterota bacterium]
ASLGYKQILLASSSVESQYAFYAADAALECLLNYDQKMINTDGYSWFSFDNACSAPPISCEGVVATIPGGWSCTSALRTYTERLSLDGGTHCADIKIYKQSSGSTDLYATGYNVPCSVVGSTDARIVVRGLHASY